MDSVDSVNTVYVIPQIPGESVTQRVRCKRHRENEKGRCPPFARDSYGNDAIFAITSKITSNEVIFMAILWGCTDNMSEN